MTSRPADSPGHEPPIRARLIEAAARLLAEQGPGALTTRRLAAEVGTSTMVVYTHFGGKQQLLTAVAREGFTRLAAHLAEVAPTDDPVIDLGNLALAYRANALANPHLYAVMFSALTGGREPSANAEIPEARRSFDAIVAATRRAIESGRFRPADPTLVATQLWSALHGFVMLELAGRFVPSMHADPEHVFTTLLVTMALGLAEDPTSITRPSGPEGSG
ncbi:TetR family transcriptional regulator [Longimycelium tulufanense]|uniref:TetR family transcriptional regulator n=1 Tax=Longimycelium tulufanense TaxID=907463 RepID=A0A8J3C864_9PSEU|nr:TetR/AcrR family transcriptional regulator [Longimycelium tulufanense]GGM52488.1 TetR family transcriptional regulator [Longimycelium tulufanense]